MPNALAAATSPYLLQHADNPVTWLPWGDAALAKARAEQKPVFLSIGYATCHWCHVMARESFENAEVAAVLNEHFVPVKVDREERPDVDKVYMAYVQAMTGHGGWPLNVWLTPDLKPFYGGTYFPPQDREGRAGFATILQAIARGWRDERDKLVAEGERVIATLREFYQTRGEAAEGGADGVPAGPAETLAEAAAGAFERGFEYYYEQFDAANGGFGGAPKFPRPANLNFLFRVAALQGVDSEMGGEAVRLATSTLRAMAQGGVHDHLGGGYHRYAVDDGWFVPHFEKMLHDQAQLALACLEAKQATGDERYAWMARDIFDYVARDLTGPRGEFFSAEDADSAVPGGAPGAHAEGAFYVWTAAELQAVLWTDYGFFAGHYGVKDEGNVPAHLDPHGEFRGKNILAQRRGLADSARAAGLGVEEANKRLLAAVEKLRAHRAERPRPLRDDKVVTAGCGLMISALARAYRILGDEAYRTAAERAADFVAAELHDGARGVLFRCWRGTRGDTEGFAEDYAMLVQGLLDLYEATFEVRWLQWADWLQTKMDELFWDEEGGGYFNSAAWDTSLVLRLKEDYDGAEPAPGSVAAMNLLRLAARWDDPDRRERGRRTIEAMRGRWAKTPQALPQLLCALELALEPPRQIVLAGDPRAADFRALAAVTAEQLGPHRVLLAADGGEGQRWLATRAPWLADMKPLGGAATAYLCEDYGCHAPARTADELRALLARR
jgi:uncharacterized protein YyaL (SSP411 family)